LLSVLTSRAAGSSAGTLAGKAAAMTRTPLSERAARHTRGAAPRADLRTSRRTADPAAAMGAGASKPGPFATEVYRARSTGETGVYRALCACRARARARPARARRAARTTASSRASSLAASPDKLLHQLDGVTTLYENFRCVARAAVAPNRAC
jgi:hypothetical protein